MISPPRRVVLALAVGVLCAVAVGACGGGSSTTSSGARQLVAQTVKATSASLRNGRLDARLQLEPKGVLALGGPISLTVSGPFARPRRGGLALLDLAIVATLAGQRYGGGVISDGGHAFLKLAGRAYRLDGKGTAQRLLALKLDPLRWIKSAQAKGNEQIAGTDTVHVTGTVDSARLLGDLGGLLPAALGRRIAAAVTSADFELWSGAGDKILRQFVLRVAFQVAQGAQPPIPGLEAGSIELRIRLDDVNRTQTTIKAPATSLALSRVPGDRGLGGLIACLGKSADGGAGIAPCVTSLVP